MEHCLEAVLIEDLHQGVSEQLILNILFCFLLFTLSRFSKNSLILGDAVFIKSCEWDRLGPGAGEGCGGAVRGPALQTPSAPDVL